MISSEFKRQIAAAVSGDLNPVETRRLHQELKRNPAARRFYHELMRDNAALRKLPAARPTHSFVPAIIAASQAMARPGQTAARWKMPIDFSRWISSGVVAATLVLCILGTPQLVNLANRLGHSPNAAPPNSPDSPTPSTIDVESNSMARTTPTSPALDEPGVTHRLSRNGAGKENKSDRRKQAP